MGARKNEPFKVNAPGQYEPTPKYIGLVNELTAHGFYLIDIARWAGVSKATLSNWGVGRRPGLGIEVFFDNPVNRERLHLSVGRVAVELSTAERETKLLNIYFSKEEA